MAKLKDILAMIDATKDTATVKYLADDYVQYALNGMPGAIMTIAKNSVLNLEVSNIECLNNRLVITTKAPVTATAQSSENTQTVEGASNGK